MAKRLSESGLDAFIQASIDEDPSFAMEWERLQAVGRLIDCRVKRDLTQADVAKIMGVSRPRISEFEAGHNVGSSFLFAYAAAVGATLTIKQNPAPKKKTSVKPGPATK